MTTISDGLESSLAMKPTGSKSEIAKEACAQLAPGSDAKSMRTIENVSIPSFIDKYYEKKNLTGVYPEKEWWKSEHKE